MSLGLRGPLLPVSPGAKRNGLIKAHLCHHSVRNPHTEAPGHRPQSPTICYDLKPPPDRRARPQKPEDPAAAEVRAAAAASGAAVRRRVLTTRRRRPEVTSPKSVLVHSHLSSGRLGCGRLCGYRPPRVPPGDPALLSCPSAPALRTLLLQPDLSLLSFPGRGPDRAEPGHPGAVPDHGVPLQEENRGR